MGRTGQKQERVLRTMVAPLWDKLMQGVSVMSRQGWPTWFWGPSVHGETGGTRKPVSGGGNPGAHAQEERGWPRTAPGDRIRGPRSLTPLLQQNSKGAMGPAVPALLAENADQHLLRTSCTPDPDSVPCVHAGVFRGQGMLVVALSEIQGGETTTRRQESRRSLLRTECLCPPKIYLLKP